jgi:hypothetical protein
MRLKPDNLGQGYNERTYAPEELLDKVDKEIITRGLGVLKTMLLETDPASWPTTIMYPDTTARPLVYAVKPLFDLMYTQQGLTPPKHIFINTPNSLDKDLLKLQEDPITGDRRYFDLANLVLHKPEVDHQMSNIKRAITKIIRGSVAANTEVKDSLEIAHKRKTSRIISNMDSLIKKNRELPTISTISLSIWSFYK